MNAPTAGELLRNRALSVARPSFSVIICAYTEKRWDDLIDAVDSVHAQTLAPAEVILVVDHAPQLLEKARARFDRVRVVANDETKGLSGARNTGVLLASGDVVAFLDDDAVADPRWLEALASAYADPLVLGVGGTVQARWDGSRPRWFPEEFDWVVGCSYRGQPRQTSVVRNVIGCNMSFRKEVLDEVGGFRRELGRVDTLPSGCEETEMCIRARQRFPFGKIVLEPGSLVHHRVTSERATHAYFRSRCRAEGRSKAILAEVVGDTAALASERSYATRVLPLGVVRSLVVRRHGGSPMRAVTIVRGFLFVTSGYIQGRVESRRGANAHAV